MEEALQKNERVQEQDSSPENNLQHPNAPESDSAATDKSSEVFCSNCGKRLKEDEAFCSVCGIQRETVPQAEKQLADSDNKNDANKTSKKKIIPILVLVVVVVVIAILICAILFGGNKKEADFQKVYDEYCSSPWAKIGSDGSYLSIDTNPYDKDDGDYRYLFVANDAIEKINPILGFNDSVYEEMNNTTAMMGKQSANNADNTVTASWTYHPDNGLEVTYKKVSS